MYSSNYMTPKVILGYWEGFRGRG